MKRILTLLLSVTLTAIIACSHSNEAYPATDYFVGHHLNMAQAIDNEDIDAINNLIKRKGYEINGRGHISRQGLTHQWTYLNYAVYKGRLQSAATLLKLGADVNALAYVDNAYYSNMNLAAKTANRAMMKLLLEHRINLNPQLAASPLYELISYDHDDIELFDLLLAHGLDVNHPTYISGTTLLMTAYAINNHKVMDYLLRRGGNPLQIDFGGNSFASMLDRDIKADRNSETAKKYKQILIHQYGISYPVDVSFRKGLEATIQRYQHLSDTEKKRLGSDGLARINTYKKALKTGQLNGIALD